MNSELITRNDLALTETLFFLAIIHLVNTITQDATIAFIVTSKRFDDPLLNMWELGSRD